jgi:hypothetical protein
VVAITTLAVNAGHMTTATSAALVGAAILSTTIYPFVGLTLQRGADDDPEPTPSTGAIDVAAQGG